MSGRASVKQTAAKSEDHLANCLQGANQNVQGAGVKQSLVGQPTDELSSDEVVTHCEMSK
jgi:hypothetical protein